VISVDSPWIITGPRRGLLDHRHQQDLVHRKQSGIINENPSEKAIALDLARRAALGTFQTVEERVVGLYHEDGIWCEDRPAVMDERPCDHEENGTKACKNT
jgi:hypothetical protein